MQWLDLDLADVLLAISTVFVAPLRVTAGFPDPRRSCEALDRGPEFLLGGRLGKIRDG